MTTGAASLYYQKCRLCTCLFEISTAGPSQRSSNGVNLLLNYLYHQNVRETTSCGVGGVEGDPSPKLTFTLSAGQLDRNSGSHQQPIQMCQKCQEELQNLDKLHQELQAVKRKIQSQIQVISYRQKHSGTKQEAINDLIQACHIPRMQICIAGSVTANENIKQTLDFIGNLTDNLVSPGASAVANTKGVFVKGVQHEQKVEPENAKTVPKLVSHLDNDKENAYHVQRPASKMSSISQRNDDSDLSLDESGTSEEEDGEEYVVDGRSSRGQDHPRGVTFSARRAKKKCKSKVRTCTVCGKGVLGKTNLYAI